MAEDEPRPPASPGAFPDGRLGSGDEGEVGVAVGVEEGRVVVDFGKDLRWLGLTPAQARDVAHALLEAARRAIGGRVQ
jgi:hypothetical protein